MFYIIIALVAFLLLYPFLRFILERMSMICKIKRICRSNGYVWQPSHRGYLFSNFKGRHCDFYVETSDEVYSVKLCGFALKRKMCNFIDETHYSIRNLHFQISYTAHGIQYDTKSKPHWNFKAGCPKEYYVKRIIPVLLMTPVCMNVTYMGEPVGSSDFIGECYFYTVSGFCKRLICKRNSNTIGGEL